jgi:formate hydrogenlyase subunit 6/NADH:ubiquinone oxidoreductase subunit I
LFVTLYYFTGTGNSLCIARELNAYLQQSEIIPIAKIWKQENLQVSSDIVGLISPLYYWGLPLIMKEFVERMNFKKTSYIFAVVNAGGEEPGIAFMQLDDILKEKSKRLNACFFLSMPSNYIVGGSQETEEEQKIKLLSVKEIVKKIGLMINKKVDTPLITISEKKAKTIERMNTRFHSRVHESDDLFYVDDNCTGCGVCETVCPVNNIIINDSKPEWLHDCQQCLACINYCPENAIQYGKTTLGKRRYYHPMIKPEDLSV